MSTGSVKRSELNTLIYQMALTFESVPDEILQCGHSNESY